MIPYGRQDISQEDIDSVVEVLRSDFLTQGPKVPLFEAALAQYCNASYAVAVNSATSALHIACLALELGKGDRLWTTPLTFVASSNCALYCGAEVDFVDIDPGTYNLCPLALERKLIEAEASGTLPKIVVPVHLCGEACDMQAIHALSRRFGFKIIEDASHAVGGSYQEKKMGACQYSDITVFSFHPVKVITTAEGGLATTNDPALARRMELYRSHGITRDPALMTHEADGEWYYQQIVLGYNYRMTELQAALGVNQMGRLDEFVARRHLIADRYDQMLKDLPLRTPVRNPVNYSGLHLYVIRLKLDLIIPSHAEVFDRLRAAGIGVNLHYIPVHTQPYYQELGFKVGDYPAAEAYYSEAISLPIYPNLRDDQQDEVIAALTQALK